MIHIGIDPGLRGAVVALSQDGQLLNWYDAPTFKKHNRKITYSVGEMATIIGKYANNRNAHVTIEEISTRPKQSTQSGVNSGIGFGYWVGICVAFNLTYNVVRPQSWINTILKKQLGEGKQRAIIFAKNRWPDLPLYGPRGGIRDGRADAICIAEYGRTLEKNKNEKNHKSF